MDDTASKQVDERPTKRRTRRFDDVVARLRFATPTDNPLLLELMADVPMSGSLVISTRRDPDYFALHAMQDGTAQTLVFDDGEVQAMGAFLTRDGWLDGQPTRVGYLGDLRLRGIGSARLAFPIAYAHTLERVMDETGCRVFLTAVLASNRAALQALARPSSRRVAQPVYTPFRRFEMASIQVLWHRSFRARPGVRVSTATLADGPNLATFLDEDHRARPFGYRFDAGSNGGELAHRLACWPGFSLDATWIVRDEEGAILGCCTAWDAASVKRHRVLRYGGGMLWVKRAMSVAEKLVGWKALPAEGEDFRILSLTNLSIRNDDPRTLRALLEAVYAWARPRGYHVIALPLYDADPWAPALRRFVVQRLPFHLFVVTAVGDPRIVAQPGRPGFEMALA